MAFADITTYISQIVDILGIAIITFGLIFSMIFYFRDIFEKRKNAYKNFRENFGKVILLGLEFLIAGDIITSVGTSHTFNDAIILAVIVIVRLIISFQLQFEINGLSQWKKKVNK